MLYIYSYFPCFLISFREGIFSVDINPWEKPLPLLLESVQTGNTIDRLLKSVANVAWERVIWLR